MRALLPSLLSLLAVVASGCSASSSPTAVEDGGVDGAGAEGGDAGCFPFCSGSSSGSSGGSGDAASDAPPTCAQMSALVAQLQGPAQACNPHLPSQCGGITQGVCCPITISAGNDTAVNDYETAVMSYASQCHPTCMGTVCPATPSGLCNSSAMGSGSCQ